MSAVYSTNTVDVRQDEALRRLCPYSVYANIWPPDLEGRLRHYFSLLNSGLHQHHPASITTIVATQYQSYGREPHSVRLYTFGRFRKPYAAMTQVATALADLYREFQILPIISPVFAKDWELQTVEDGTLYRDIRRFGLLCYSAHERDTRAEGRV